ncbi:hypothetical protein HOU03_gp250 [Caulobacter phage CcrSC]|uniref:Uncharacterized protein n=1 Tax=Caulobacter phage CcrSC TaxID=2283272 RepID=A0A385EGI4_9CAUD|nr:hypothetical protein HOU03_gp250 [Caulobacter phage CcrSC]AXQ70018.1 hypothetical protein CcrSC_gp436 [Caulobacter phage CcrSC]
MDRKDLDAILHLAGIKPLGIWETVNGYSKTREDPWYLVHTDFGMIHIGWRKRVISIDWEQTKVRVIVTEDDVTKDETQVHAHSMADAAVYLRYWRLFAEHTAAVARRDAIDGAPVTSC